MSLRFINNYLYYEQLINIYVHTCKADTALLQFSIPASLSSMQTNSSGKLKMLHILFISLLLSRSIFKPHFSMANVICCTMGDSRGTIFIRPVWLSYRQDSNSRKSKYDIFSTFSIIILQPSPVSSVHLLEAIVGVCMQCQIQYVAQ